MTNRNSFSPPPGYHRSVIQLRCERCGRETAAACDCCVPYVPATTRAEEYARQNPTASVREIKEQTGVGHGTAQRARRTIGTPETVTGKDGKQYPATKPANAKIEQDTKANAEWWRNAWLRDHPGKTLADYEIAGSCSDTDSGRAEFSEWMAGQTGIQYALLDQVKPAILQMNEPTREALDVWWREIHHNTIAF